MTEQKKDTQKPSKPENFTLSDDGYIPPSNAHPLPSRPKPNPPQPPSPEEKKDS